MSDRDSVQRLRAPTLRGDRIAVVVPCFNDGGTLPDVIASLHGQEIAELVVVDDGSTEAATHAILDECAAAGIRVVRQDNAGLSVARMRGVHETSARYVMPLDADDQLGPGILSVLADALDRDETAQVAWGDVELFGSFEYAFSMRGKLDPWKITYVSSVPGTSLVRRSALLEAGGWQLTGGNEDWDLWMSYAERGWHGAYVPRLMLRYRLQPGRMNARCIEEHGAHVATLAARHPGLFSARGRNWRRSTASLRARILFPLVDRLPVSDGNRRRLLHLVDHPGRVLRLRVLRGRAARSFASAVEQS